jgi:hypothetical protein
MLKDDYTSLLCHDGTDWVNCGYTESPYSDEVRDPTGYFVTYETGDNTVVTVETGTVPLDMYYARAFAFGDMYDDVEFTTTSGQLVYRWDWLEFGEDLATEASVYGNPSGTKFYAVWNQELPLEEEVFTNMDSEFRRIQYNFTLDTYPIGGILWQSHLTGAYDRDNELVFVGAARDSDRMGEGIVDFQWESSIDGILGTEQVLTVPVTDLSLGVHTISFTAQDNEGHWSMARSITFLVAETLYDVYLPIAGR